MKCSETAQEVVPFYTNELDPKRMEEYKRHTMICKKCARYAYRIRKAMEFIKDNNQEPIKQIDLLE
jgi:hypothetical protein